MLFGSLLIIIAMVERFTMPIFEVAPAKKSILASVVFGQSSLSCRGNGICRVDMLTRNEYQSLCYNKQEASNSVCQKVPVILNYVESKGISLKCFVSAMPKEVYQQQLGKGYFIVKEDFLLPIWLQNELPGGRQAIKRGVYQVEKIGNTISIWL